MSLWLAIVLIWLGAVIGFIWGAALTRRKIEHDSETGPYHVDRIRCSVCQEVIPLQPPTGYRLMLVKQ